MAISPASISIGDKLRSSRGIGQGFDFLRVALAVGVVAWHADFLCRHANEEAEPFFWFPGYAILSMFFALSGFLIAGSAARLRLRDFLVNRGLRIFPALAVEIVLSAFILGPIFTKLPLADYFSNAGTWRYFTNIVGLINFRLPGVFESNFSNTVNVSLWTVPYEFLCYGLMSAVMLLGLLKKPGIIIATALVLVLVGMIGAYGFHMKPDANYSSRIANAFSRNFVDHQSRLAVAFLLGIALFCLRDRIVYSRKLALLCVAVCVAVACISPGAKIGYPIVNLLAAPPLAYLVAFLGVSNIPTPALFKKGDYSYGIYLYGWPMQQVMITCFPGVHSTVLQFCMAMVLIVAFAMFSWHAIEKPILKLRKKFSFVARERLQDHTPGQAPSVIMSAAASPAEP